MASISSTSSASSANSIYGTRNVISGLATGMDTEQLIENAISSYKNKISGLQQKRTKTEWQQEAYRSIVNKMAAFTDKYTSYRSSNNLMSTSFFDQAVSKVTATGRGSSNVEVNRVKQLATAARYTVGAGNLATGTQGWIRADGDFELDKDMTVSTVSGALSIAYGGSDARNTLNVDFGELDNFDSVDDMAKFINEKLAEQSITTSSGSSKKASEMLKAEVQNGSIVFKDASGSGNEFYISGVSGDLKKTLGVTTGSTSKSIEVGNKALTKQEKTSEFLGGTGISITLDGVSKTIKAPTEEELENYIKDSSHDVETYDKTKRPATKEEAFTALLQQGIDKSFGTLANGGHKLEVMNASSESGKLRLQFKSGQEASTFQIKSDKGAAMGFENGMTSYLDTSKSLKDLLGAAKLAGLEAKDEDGNVLKDKDGNTLYEFKLNGEVIGNYTEDTALATIINNINSNANAGVTASYSKTTNEFTFTAKNTGASEQIQFGDEGKDSLAKALFGSYETTDENGNKQTVGKFTRGQDAILSVSINGGRETEITRSSNSVEIDGLTINLKGVFGYETNTDGSIKYAQKEDKNGLAFSYGSDGKEIRARKLDDGRYAILNANGTQYKYSSTDATNKFNGAEVYGRLTEDGKLVFEMSKDGEVKELYGRLGETSGNLWFSTSNTGAQDFQPVRETAAKPVNTDPVTFETSADADKIVDVVKSMVDDYNAMVTEIKNAYSTLPLKKNSKQYYEPLTEEDKDDMSESAIEAWEEKAKTGILFGDRDLSTLYRKLTSAVSMTGKDGEALKAAGITTSYSDGLTLLKFDEAQLRSTLDSDPDKVRDIFTKSTDSGSSSNGLMQALKAPLDLYGATTGTSAITGTKGVLVNKAGSPLAPSTMYSNTIQKQLDKIDEEIEKWQDKMSDQVDYYTTQFSKLEQLVAQMNSQSSAIMGMMGGN